MGWVVLAAPRSVSSSKVGLLPEVLKELRNIGVSEESFVQVEVIPKMPLHYKASEAGKTFKKKLKGYELYFFKTRTTCNNFVLAFGAVAKRHLPKKTTYAYQGVYYFVISEESPTVMATNFLNDFFLVAYGECAKEDLAKLVLANTNIGELLSQPIP